MLTSQEKKTPEISTPMEVLTAFSVVALCAGVGGERKPPSRILVTRWLLPLQSQRAAALSSWGGGVL